MDESQGLRRSLVQNFTQNNMAVLGSSIILSINATIKFYNGIFYEKIDLFTKLSTSFSQVASGIHAT